MKELKKPLVIRLPEAMRTWVDEQASKNGRSTNGEVVFRLRTMMERELRIKESNNFIKQSPDVCETSGLFVNT